MFGQQRRQAQALAWMWERIDAGLKQAFRANPALASALPEHVAAVQSGRLAASTAARHLLGLHAGTATPWPGAQAPATD